MCMCGYFARFRKNTVMSTLSQAKESDLTLYRERVYGSNLRDPFQAGLCETLDSNSVASRPV